MIDHLGFAQFHNLDIQNEFTIKGNIWPALFSSYTFLYVDGYMKIYNSKELTNSLSVFHTAFAGVHHADSNVGTEQWLRVLVYL